MLGRRSVRMPGRRPAGWGVPMAGWRRATNPERTARAERGSGSVLVLAIVGAVLALTAGLVPLLGVFVHSQVAANAADAAALAAADALAGAVPGVPCELAELVARRHGTRLVSCDGAGAEASVSVAARVLTFEITARARAGPPESRDDLAEARAGPPEPCDDLAEARAGQWGPPEARAGSAEARGPPRSDGVAPGVSRARLRLAPASQLAS
ncbi:Rv3654c family TadE-like protein [Agromyces aerolatus]|uniref:Rv3654c family TadE-like protein n=1 Tax=Agromyces sp. LY-1074 TaxID=3074080 RepID=UPI0028636DEB|nr:MULTISPECIES: Rv3654c family TadE-like protein [unclassified Agromyces]MDR5700261.1 flp pilus-assembly TadE/G-like family protein [Agromyces sp. LY-1074]MDR5706761.1 flp pilus-assembly TadE/G-like family protein [Agromyces sp. LY-1358]